MACIFGCVLQSESEEVDWSALLDALNVQQILTNKDSLKKYQIRVAELKMDANFYRCHKCSAGNLRDSSSQNEKCIQCNTVLCVKCGQAVWNYK